ncbi:MAG: 3-oxoacyl-[acyl-carrier-protein] synthase II [Candidatus Omnitrophota bacterium]|jgi:3-oxoacyl-[acyl-carrier-protein] synthase II
MLTVKNNKVKVFVTGLGAVTPLANNVPDTWDKLVRGCNSSAAITTFDTGQYKHSVGCEVKNFNESNHLSKVEMKLFGKATQFALEATTEALLDANLKIGDDCDRSRVAVVIGTTFGEAQILENSTHLYYKSPMLKGTNNSYYKLRQYRPQILAANIANKFGCAGPNFVVPAACAAGNYAIWYASMLIKLGLADVAIAGGADPLSHVSFSGFSRLGVMSYSNCRPFDAMREGMLVGEGAGILILENSAHYKTRVSKAYAEIVSCGISCDAQHMTIPSTTGVKAMMDLALCNAELSSKEIDYICAHGTGTIMNDKIESQSIREIFYNKSNPVPVSSIKSMIGHTMGAASAIEAISCCKAIETGILPPTINYENQDPDCDLDYIPNTPRRRKLNYVLNNAAAFGGNNASLLLGRIN